MSLSQYVYAIISMWSKGTSLRKLIKERGIKRRWDTIGLRSK
jgi:hypothetical protein